VVRIGWAQPRFHSLLRKKWLTQYHQHVMRASFDAKVVSVIGRRLKQIKYVVQVRI